MFVLLKGATKEQAFKIGQEIAEAVTATNPKPVKLKFEKVLGGGVKPWYMGNPLYLSACALSFGVVPLCFLFFIHALDILRLFSVCSQVYLPCVLQTKKRYVGYMYESLDQKEPVFDAKGIETVRRDSCPAVSKVTGKPTRLLPPQFHCVLHQSLPRRLPSSSGLLTLIHICQSGSCQFMAGCLC